MTDEADLIEPENEKEPYADEAMDFYRSIEPPTEAEKEIIALRHGYKKTREVFVRALHLVYGYEGNIRMALDCLLFALGEGPEIKMMSAMDIARKYTTSKQRVTKCITNFQKRCAIPAIPGQRDEQGNANMAKQRKEQLKK